MLVKPLPKATPRMLELDYLHRANNPLGPALAARLQWTVADALNSPFGKATAEADLGRAEAAGLERLADDAAARAAMAFARKLTLEGYAISDEEFAALLKLFGPEKVVAIVHTVAYANFFNRLVLGLGVEGEPVSPVEVKLDPDRLAKLTAPSRPPWADLGGVKDGGLSIRPNWGEASAEELSQTLERQKERKLRIPLPDAAKLDALPPKERDSARAILWNTVSLGYQPALPRTWFAALYAFYDDAKVDRLFTNSMFWVVTRTNQCFY
jgi:hypothetical protein